MLSLIKYFESLSLVRQTYLVIELLVADYLMASLVMCLLDLKVNKQTDLLRGMKLTCRALILISTAIINSLRDLRIPFKSLIKGSNFKYTRNQREFIKYLVHNLSNYLQIETPEILYNASKYTKAEININEGKFTSKLMIGESVDGIATLCHEIASELRRVYQQDLVNDDDFMAEKCDDEYLAEYANKVKKSLNAAPDITDKSEYYSLFHEVDADAFAKIVVNILFRKTGKENIMVYYPTREENEIPDEEIDAQVKNITENETVYEYLYDARIDELCDEFRASFE